MDFSHACKEQMRLHPAMLPRDAVKLCYQAAYGAEHLLTDCQAARAYFDEEYAAVCADGSGLAEPISAHFSRVNLAAWKASGLPRAWLFAMFCRTAADGAAPDGDAVFWRGLQEIEMLASNGETPFSLKDWRAFLENYDTRTPAPLHHSEAYRESERPAYRIVSAGLTRLIGLLRHMAAHTPPRNAAFILAIDGRAASGKTTLAKTLAGITGAGIVHMDDFFLPAELRTEARFAKPGGNVHYERFAEEAAPCLASEKAFSYRVFDCSEMRMDRTRLVCRSPWRIVEGSYSCHPELGGYMQTKVFCDVEPGEQRERIRRRNGEEMASVFQSRWIPMEELYFRAFRVKENADIVLDHASGPVNPR